MSTKIQKKLNRIMHPIIMEIELKKKAKENSRNCKQNETCYQLSSSQHSNMNSSIDNIDKLMHLRNTYKCIEKIELLPFKKICQSKYDSLNIDFKFKDFEVPSMEIIENLNNHLNK